MSYLETNVAVPIFNDYHKKEHHCLQCIRMRLKTHHANTLFSSTVKSRIEFRMVNSPSAKALVSLSTGSSSYLLGTCLKIVRSRDVSTESITYIIEIQIIILYVRPFRGRDVCTITEIIHSCRGSGTLWHCGCDLWSDGGGACIGGFAGKLVYLARQSSIRIRIQRR
jgi:hypothetical protein